MPPSVVPAQHGSMSGLVKEYEDQLAHPGSLWRRPAQDGYIGNVDVPRKQAPAHTSAALFAEWAAAMSRGSFEAAWQVNDRCGSHWPSAHRLWKGDRFADASVIIRSYHGLGDAVQMLRFVPWLQAQAAHVAFDLPAPLSPLLEYFCGMDRDAPPQSTALPRDHDRTCEVEIMELPYLLRVQLPDVFVRKPYLRLPCERVKATAAYLGARKKLRVGLVWAGGDWDRGRWIPVKALKPLFEQTNVEWWNLQGGHHVSDVSCDVARRTNDFAEGGLLELAQRIATMDIVVTVDTLAAHLAGAMGKCALVLLKHQADWRWLRDRSDSPWYPTLTLLRQPVLGDWTTVIRRVIACLNGSAAIGDDSLSMRLPAEASGEQLMPPS